MERIEPVTAVPEDMPIMLEVKEAAALANCSGKHIRELLRSGKLEGARLGNTWRVNRDALLKRLGLAA